jgi:hypothetical protein
MRLWVAVCVLVFSLPALAQSGQSSSGPQTAASAEEAVKKSENPFADKISLSLNNTISFNSEPLTAAGYEFDLQSVLPTRLGNKWQVLHRPLLPLLHEPGSAPGETGEFGLGDFTYQAFVTPHKNSTVLWGAGPTLVIPTATNSRLGSGKWSVGPTLGVVSQPGNWSLVVVASNIWSFAGDSARDSINQLSLELKLDYNVKAGWYVGYEPVFSADWKVGRGERWLVPIGGGIGKAVALGAQNAVFSAYCNRNIARPIGAPEWQFQFGVQFEFKKPRKTRPAGRI